MAFTKKKCSRAKFTTFRIRTSAVFAFRFLPFDDRVRQNFARGRYTPTVPFLFVTLDPEVCTVRLAPGHVRVRRSGRIARFHTLIQPAGLFFCNIPVRNRAVTVVIGRI